MTEPKPKKRVALFISYYRGMEILKNLLADRELMDRIEIVGVVTDIPGVNCPTNIRHWQYGYTEDEAQMVKKFAEAKGIPVYAGKVKDEAFYAKLENEWKPDIIYMGTFGQKLDERILKAAPAGVFNTHPYDGGQWPSKEYAGRYAFQNILKNKLPHFVLALHRTDEKLDNGELVYNSTPVAVPYEAMKDMDEGKQVQHLHKVIAPAAADLVNTHLRCELGLALTPAQAKVGYVDLVENARRAGRMPSIS